MKVVQATGKVSSSQTKETIQYFKSNNFFYFFFAHLDPTPDPADQIQCGSAAVLEGESHGRSKMCQNKTMLSLASCFLVSRFWAQRLDKVTPIFGHCTFFGKINLIKRQSLLFINNN
jgi:hypothetical protein